MECRIKDATIDEEYNNSFPLGFALVKDVKLLVDQFKRSSSKLVYHPLLRQHVNTIKTKTTHVEQV
jgi:hypothetical protein